MKITQIRENGDTEALSVTDIDLLIEKMKKAFILLAAALFLSGCGLTKEDLGMAASKPDETQVTRRNQLVIPPDFDVRPQQ